ncbi:MAG: hypothetical protein AAFX01_04030 [Cyanobacteria bacterium J06638_28]
MVFRDAITGTYQQETTLTDGTVSPIAFPDAALAVNRFVRR